MALEFRKRLIRKPGKKAQYALALGALLLALCLLFSWMFIRHKLDHMPAADPNENSSNVDRIVYTAEDKANLLIVYDAADFLRFLLVQADPAREQMHVTAIPREMVIENGATIEATYKKDGAPQTVNALSATLGLPIRHYLSMTEANVAKWIGGLESGVPFTLSEAIGQEGDASYLPIGEHTLTADQVVTILNYTHWQDASLRDRIGAQMIAAVLDTYMIKTRHLASDFADLSNRSQTSLRIGDFNEHKTMLSHIAANNDGTICRIFTLPTASEDGNTIPDVNQFKKTTFFYN